MAQESNSEMEFTTGFRCKDWTGEDGVHLDIEVAPPQKSAARLVSLVLSEFTAEGRSITSVVISQKDFLRLAEVVSQTASLIHVD